MIYFRFGKLNRSLHGGVEQLFRSLIIDSRMGEEGEERGAICACVPTWNLSRAERGGGFVGGCPCSGKMCVRIHTMGEKIKKCKPFYYSIMFNYGAYLGPPKAYHR